MKHYWDLCFSGEIEADGKDPAMWLETLDPSALQNTDREHYQLRLEIQQGYSYVGHIKNVMVYT